MQLSLSFYENLCRTSAHTRRGETKHIEDGTPTRGGQAGRASERAYVPPEPNPKQRERPRDALSLSPSARFPTHTPHTSIRKRRRPKVPALARPARPPPPPPPPLDVQPPDDDSVLFCPAAAHHTHGARSLTPPLAHSSASGSGRFAASSATCASSTDLYAAFSSSNGMSACSCTSSGSTSKGGGASILNGLSSVSCP